MKTLIELTMIINIVLTLVFGLGSYFLIKNEEINPKLRANIATIITFFMFLYSAVFVFISIFGFLKHNDYLLFGIIFALSPFIIGKLAHYKTLRKYSIIQFCCFLISLFYIFFAL